MAGAATGRVALPSRRVPSGAVRVMVRVTYTRWGEVTCAATTLSAPTSLFTLSRRTEVGEMVLVIVIGALAPWT